MDTNRTDISHRTIPTVNQAAGNPLLITLARARKGAVQSQQPRYVHAVNRGWTITTEAPAGRNGYYEIHANTAFQIEPGTQTDT